MQSNTVTLISVLLKYFILESQNVVQMLMNKTSFHFCEARGGVPI